MRQTSQVTVTSMANGINLNCTLLRVERVQPIELGNGWEELGIKTGFRVKLKCPQWRGRRGSSGATCYKGPLPRWRLELYCVFASQ
jgi:hypothetical protein